MGIEEDVTEIKGIYISFTWDWESGDKDWDEQTTIRTTIQIEEESHQALILITYRNLSQEYGGNLKDYLCKYFDKGKTKVKLKIKGQLEESKYEYNGTGLIKRLE